MNSIFQNNYIIKTTAPKQCEVFEFQNENGQIKHIFQRQEISVQVDGQSYYDLVSPVGFGGPMILSCHSNQKWDLIFDFTRAFEAFCLEQHIVSEQVEFHAPYGHPADFLECYIVDYERDRFGIDVTKPLDHSGNEDLSKLWNAIDLGVEFRVVEGQSAISSFKKFVQRTDGQIYLDLKKYIEFMDTNAFENFVVVELIYKNQVFAMSCNQIYEDSVYTHCSTASSRRQYFKTDKLLKCALYLWAKETGLQQVWSPDEKNYSRMGIETLIAPVCTGRKIWNNRIYQELCEISNIDKRVRFFPAYRFLQ